MTRVILEMEHPYGGKEFKTYKTAKPPHKVLRDLEKRFGEKFIRERIEGSGVIVLISKTTTVTVYIVER